MNNMPLPLTKGVHQLCWALYGINASCSCIVLRMYDQCNGLDLSVFGHSRSHCSVLNDTVFRNLSTTKSSTDVLRNSFWIELAPPWKAVYALLDPFFSGHSPRMRNPLTWTIPEAASNSKLDMYPMISPDPLEPLVTPERLVNCLQNEFLVVIALSANYYKVKINTFRVLYRKHSVQYIYYSNIINKYIKLSRDFPKT